MKHEPKQLPSGSWHLLVYDYTDANGKRHNKSFTHKNRRTVIDMARKFCKERDLRTDDEVENADMSLSKACERYIEIKRDILSPTTIRSYVAYKNGHLSDLKDMSLKYIDSKKIQQYINELVRKGNSPKTIKNKVTFIKQSIDYFMPDNNIRIQYPQRKKAQIYAPYLSDFWKIYEAADEDMKIPILLGGMCGLRRSEIAALTPADVTDIGINVDKALVKGENGWELKPPKSESGTRVVPLHIDYIKLVKKWSFDINPDHITRMMRKTCDKLGFKKIHFHCLRHMFCTELYGNYMTPVQIKDYSGHSTAAMVTEIYTHVRRDIALDNKVINIMTGSPDPEQKERSS